MNAPAAVKGFTLIELMVVVTIIGILSALAVPNYEAYIVRARVSEGISFVSPYKTQLAEYVVMNGRVPLADQDYYVNGGQVVVTRVKWSVTRNAIEVWFGPAAGQRLNGTILWLMPTPSTGSIRWICRGHTGDGGASWKIESRYLPTSCRP